MDTWVNCGALKMGKTQGGPYLSREGWLKWRWGAPDIEWDISVKCPWDVLSPFWAKSLVRLWLCTYHLQRSENKQNLLWSKYYTGDAQIGANLKDAGEQRKTMDQEQNSLPLTVFLSVSSGKDSFLIPREQHMRALLIVPLALRRGRETK